ncbi:MAG: helix-turn-helix transcriptional regulator [Clostridia bacterium]|nr:helix-turn-helix transcriptional regulator [Clostridia bacterium]
MTFGEKLSKLRREHNYTQEQLADALDVSRQAIGKWESDISYPETDKLIKLGVLFDCSMDYLLKTDIQEKNATSTSHFDELKEEISRAATSKKNRRIAKGGLIAVICLLALSLLAALIFIVAVALPRFREIEEKYQEMQQQTMPARTCLLEECNALPIESGFYCKDHTCTAEGCTSGRESDRYCYYHTYAQQ